MTQQQNSKPQHMPNDLVSVRYLTGPNKGKTLDNYTRLHATWLESRGTAEIVPPETPETPEEQNAPGDGDASGVRNPKTKPVKPTRTKPASARKTKSK